MGKTDMIGNAKSVALKFVEVINAGNSEKWFFGLLRFGMVL